MCTGSPCLQEMNASFHFVDGIVNRAAWYPIAGIKGQEFDEMNNTLSGAQVQIDNRETPIPFNTSASGEYYRLLLPATYKIKVKD
ncbi:carboxypeptidase M-like [Scyliorhinus canicula]|uniref:carboxypeptidase M-like n=1 Tax=Scyliorhinus canicula TaxID=7830 RepID=UPI0018F611AD|nr:carboxypeptidase M-like [Scyliorhinus canicula]